MLINCITVKGGGESLEYHTNKKPMTTGVQNGPNEKAAACEECNIQYAYGGVNICTSGAQEECYSIRCYFIN